MKVVTKEFNIYSGGHQDYLNSRILHQQTLHDTQQEVSMEVSLMDLIEYDDVIRPKGRVCVHLPQQKTLRQEDYLSVFRSTSFKAYLIAHARAVLVEGLVGDAFGEGDAGYAAGLRAGYVGVACLHQVLGNLGGGRG